MSDSKTISRMEINGSRFDFYIWFEHKGKKHLVFAEASGSGFGCGNVLPDPKTYLRLKLSDTELEILDMKDFFLDNAKEAKQLVVDLFEEHLPEMRLVIDEREAKLKRLLLENQK